MLVITVMAVVSVIVVVPIPVCVPSFLVRVPPVMIFVPTSFTRFLKLMTRMFSLFALVTPMFDSLMQPVISLAHSLLAIICTSRLPAQPKDSG